jgi:hypothetical protein
MFCGMCGAEVKGNAKFCPKCGTAINVEEQAPEQTPENMPTENVLDNEMHVEDKTEVTENVTAPNGTVEAEQIYKMQTYTPSPKFTGNKYEKVFVEPDENYIASLGDGYLNSFLTSRKIKRCVALLSDKRVYLRGNMLDINSGKIARINMQKTLDLEDITGTGFIYMSPKIWSLVLGIIYSLAYLFLIMLWGLDDWDTAFPFAILALASYALYIISYIKDRHTFFFIEYAGGCIKFDASIYGLAEAQDFEKQIRRTKNKVKENG